MLLAFTCTFQVYRPYDFFICCVKTYLHMVILDLLMDNFIR